MNTTGPVMTVTDELLAELETHYRSVNDDSRAPLITELRRLRAENAELAQSLAESRANDQAAMGWLTSLRWASGDRGERMLPELVAHIEWLVKDAGRYRWLRDSIWYVGPDDFYCGEGGDMNEYENHNCQADTLDTAIDTAMAAQ